MKKTTLRDVGESAFIERIARGIVSDFSVCQGIGDDAAVVRIGKDTLGLFTCDMLIEDSHFLRRDPPRAIGHKAIACSLSDIAAMGGIPRYALASVAFPPDLDSTYARAIFTGMRRTAQEFNVTLIGGDTNAAEKIVVDVFVFGTVKPEHLTLRSQAKDGDYIFVTGSLGGSRKGRHLRFTPRVRESQFLVNNFPVHAMIDISDGLFSDIGHIVTQSKKRAVLWQEAIPRSPAAESWDDVYAQGEDFELLFTLPRQCAPELMASWPFRNHVKVTCIGEISAGKPGLLLKDAQGRLRAAAARGYRHF